MTSRRHFLYFRARSTNLLHDAKRRYVHLYFLRSFERLVLSDFKVVEHEYDAIFFSLRIIHIFNVILVVYLILFCPSTRLLSGVFDYDFTTKKLYVTRMIRSLQR